MTRAGLCIALWALGSPLAWAGAPAAASPTVAVPSPKPRDERIVPLGAAEVRELFGGATQQVGAAAPTPLSRGLTVGGELRIQTATPPGGRLELRFADGTLLRLGEATAISLLPSGRQIALHHGRLLVVADRMVGGLTVLTAGRAFVPEGTTYLVESPAGPPGAAGARLTRLSVLEGAVCACQVAAPVAAPSKPGQPVLRPAPFAQRDQMILSGESWSSADRPAGATATPQTFDLLATLRSEPLVAAFAAPLPSLSKIAELAEQQRRKILAGRNARLRREIFWRRPPRAPLRLPALFAEPSSVTVTYE